MTSLKQYDIYLMLYVQSWARDDGRKDRPKHVDFFFNILLTVHLNIFIS